MNTKLSAARLWISLLADAAIVVAFVAIGRRNHDEDLSWSGFGSAVAPFVIALCLSWLAGRVWTNPYSLKSGAIVWIGTVTIGMLLRRLMFDDGTATAFVIVAAIFVGALVNGWRAAVRLRENS